MAKVTPENFAESDQESQLGYIQHHMAEAARARRVTSGDRSVERQDLSALREYHNFLREEGNRADRMRRHLTKHARS